MSPIKKEKELLEDTGLRALIQKQYVCGKVEWNN